MVCCHPTLYIYIIIFYKANYRIVIFSVSQQVCRGDPRPMRDYRVVDWQKQTPTASPALPFSFTDRQDESQSKGKKPPKSDISLFFLSLSMPDKTSSSSSNTSNGWTQFSTVRFLLGRDLPTELSHSHFGLGVSVLKSKRGDY